MGLCGTHSSLSCLLCTGEPSAGHSIQVFLTTAEQRGVITSPEWLPMLHKPISSVSWCPNVMVLKSEASSLGCFESLHFPTRQAQTLPVSPSVQLSVHALVPAKSWRRSEQLFFIISATPQTPSVLPVLCSPITNTSEG